MSGHGFTAPPSDLSLLGAVPALLGFRPEAMATATLLDPDRRVLATVLFGGAEGAALPLDAAAYAALLAAAGEQVLARWAAPTDDPAAAQSLAEQLHAKLHAAGGVPTRSYAVIGGTVSPAWQPGRAFPLPTAAADGYVAAAELLLGAPADCPATYEQAHRWRACSLRDGIADAAEHVLPEAQAIAVADSAGWRRAAALEAADRLCDHRRWTPDDALRVLLALSDRTVLDDVAAAVRAAAEGRRGADPGLLVDLATAAPPDLAPGAAAVLAAHRLGAGQATAVLVNALRQLLGPGAGPPDGPPEQALAAFVAAPAAPRPAAGDPPAFLAVRAFPDPGAGGSYAAADPAPPRWPTDADQWRTR